MRADVYDVDANDMTAPHPLGVLSHYDAVVWEKGDDYVTRRPGPARPDRPGARRDRDPARRARLPQRGRQAALHGPARRPAGRRGLRVPQLRVPGAGRVARPGRWCGANDNESVDGCIPPDNDFQQYYLGAYIYVGGGNAQDADGNPLPDQGRGRPVRGQRVRVQRRRTRPTTRSHTATFALTSSILDPERFPWYADSRRIATWQRPGAGPFAPYSGQYYMSAGADSAAFKRLRREVDLTGKTSGSLSFKFSADLEPNWDYMAVEVREVGTENWTTLPAAGVTEPGHGRRAARRAGRGLELAAPAARALPDGQRRRDVLADRHHRRVERLHGQLRGLAGLDGRPERLRRQEDRGLDLGHHRLGHARASASGSTTRRSRSTARRRRSTTSSPTPAAGSSGRRPRAAPTRSSAGSA